MCHEDPGDSYVYFYYRVGLQGLYSGLVISAMDRVPTRVIVFYVQYVSLTYYHHLVLRVEDNMGLGMTFHLQLAVAHLAGAPAVLLMKCTFFQHHKVAYLFRCYGAGSIASREAWHVCSSFVITVWLVHLWYVVVLRTYFQHRLSSTRGNSVVTLNGYTQRFDGLTY